MAEAIGSLDELGLNLDGVAARDLPSGEMVEAAVALAGVASHQVYEDGNEVLAAVDANVLLFRAAENLHDHGFGLVVSSLVRTTAA